MSNYGKILGAGNYLSLNKHLILSIGVESTLLITLFLEFQKEGGADNSFPAPRDIITRKIGLSSYQQKNSENILTKLGILKVFRRGVPAKNYYKVDEQKLIDAINSDSDTLKNLTTI